MVNSPYSYIPDAPYIAWGVLVVYNIDGNFLCFDILPYFIN
jgi:hypothetical protein